MTPAKLDTKAGACLNCGGEGERLHYLGRHMVECHGCFGVGTDPKVSALLRAIGEQLKDTINGTWTVTRPSEVAAALLTGDASKVVAALQPKEGGSDAR